MTFSFCVCVHNEGKDYLQKCISNIQACMSVEDELIIVDDYSTEESTVEFLKSLKNATIKQHHLNNNFAEHKNYLLSLAKRELIWLFDADEYMPASEMVTVKKIVNFYKNVDCFYLPRKNILHGVTEEIAQKMNWNIQNGLLNFPDYQARIFKNDINIKYEGKLHEQVKGFTTPAWLPIQFNIAIMHIKSTERQLAQHYFYEDLKKHENL